MDGNLHALDAEKGTLKWRFKIAGNYFGAEDDRVYALG